MINSNNSDYYTFKRNEKYFRPSKLPALNIRNFDYDFFDKYYNKVTLPNYLFSSPKDTIINYFSILREASNISKGGCGSIGNALAPYPISYKFFTSEYQTNVSFTDYMKLFKNTGHINLIKINHLTNVNILPGKYKYFFEIEVIEPSVNGNTSFAYYYGFIYLKNENGKYKISEIDLRGEDFLCAAYHGWVHNAELYVATTYGDWCNLIKKRHPTEQIGYIKNIYVTGTNGHEYKFKFFQLTNGTDIEVGQFIKDSSNEWKPIKIDVNKCIKRCRYAYFRSHYMPYTLKYPLYF